MNDRPGPIRAKHLIGLSLLFVVMFPFPSPSGVEFVYLLGPYRHAFPEFLAGDWALATGSEKTVVFDWLLAPAMSVLPIGVVGILGRTIGYLGFAWLFLRLGRHLGVGPPATIVVAAVWLTSGQSLVAYETVVGALQPKLYAYVIWLFVVDRVLVDRHRSAALALGLVFSLHPSVGMAAGLATGVGVLTLGWSGRRLVESVGLAALTALPGLVPLLPALTRGGSMPRAEWKWQALVRVPVHLEAFLFSPGAMFLIVALLLLSLLIVRRRLEKPLRFILAMQGALGALFLGGFAARLTGHFELLSGYPFRAFSWFILLSTLLLIARAVADRSLLAPRWLEVVLTAQLLWLIPSIGERLTMRVRGAKTEWGPPDDLARVFRWIDTSTPAGSQLILPPWRPDSYFLARRPQVVSNAFLRLDSLTAWRSRIETLVGPRSRNQAAQRQHYLQLSVDQIETIRRRYRGEYFVSSTFYPYPVVYRSGRWLVYRVADGVVDSDAAARSTSPSLRPGSVGPTVLRSAGIPPSS